MFGTYVSGKELQTFYFIILAVFSAINIASTIYLATKIGTVRDKIELKTMAISGDENNAR